MGGERDGRESKENEDKKKEYRDARWNQTRSERIAKIKKGFLEKTRTKRDGRFRLCCPIEVDLHTLALWVSEGIKRGPVEIDLHVSDLELPRGLFTCNSLVILKLGCGIRCPIDIPPPFCFPCLKILHIDFYFPPKQLLQCLFRSCPVLEDLVIIGELGEEQGLIFDISAPALKRLKVQLYAYFHKEFKFELNVPNLEYFDVNESFLARYLVEDRKKCIQVDGNLKA
ncbi:unnamed protein product [Ilex paraguariensis]|uniref:F-box/LRR-repeat protein 15/At3g58940/PEG3-like LRR domain-containing protein n=1 Tax=Ilex paraguariensis TaxID=185542 RepID=A0ABC8RX40_9AQUA